MVKERDIGTLIDQGVDAANLVFGALLSAYIGLQLPNVPPDISVLEFIFLFISMLFFVLGLNWVSSSLWAGNKAAPAGYALISLLGGGEVLWQAHRFHLDLKVLGAIGASWWLSILILNFAMFRAVLRVKKRHAD